MTQSAMRKAYLAIVKVTVGAHAIRTASFCLGQDSRAMGAFEDVNITVCQQRCKLHVVLLITFVLIVQQAAQPGLNV